MKIIPCHSIRWSDNHCKRFPSQWPMHVHCYNYCLPISRRAIIIANCTLCIVFTKVIPRPVIHVNIRVVDFKYYSIKISFMNCIDKLNYYQRTLPLNFIKISKSFFLFSYILLQFSTKERETDYCAYLNTWIHPLRYFLHKISADVTRMY